MLTLEQLDQLQIFKLTPRVERNRQLKRVKQLAMDSKWKTVGPEGNCWWEDNQLLDDNDFWDMVGLLRSGEWRMV